MKQFTHYYAHLNASGQIDEKHEQTIQEELDSKIAKLKLSAKIKRIDFSELTQNSPLHNIFDADVCQATIPSEGDNILIKPAHMIIPNHFSISVAQVLLRGQPRMQLTNNKMYLISRGCVYEHLLKDFKPNELDRAFTKRNKDLSKAISKSGPESLSVSAMKRRISDLTRKPNQKDVGTKGIQYTRKYVAGKVIGLQNILPEFADHGEVVFFTDNHMVAEIYELDIEPLR